MSTYSYNEEQPTQATMENMYKWLTAGAKKIDKNSGGWGDSITHKKLVEKEYRLEELYKTSDLSHYKADR